MHSGHEYSETGCYLFGRALRSFSCCTINPSTSAAGLVVKPIPKGVNIPYYQSIHTFVPSSSSARLLRGLLNKAENSSILGRVSYQFCLI